ncbi:MAG: ribonuclease P protein component [Spirochaetaceae bacterium]|jgi:ribonuclease P protein component|nr:ribonuclease P protein component [Spirochaetaceae bacterium]
MAGDFQFKRHERLKSQSEIRKVFNRGKMVRCYGAKLLFIKNTVSYNRIAFTFSRKFGKAVERNRARRLAREAYRHIKPLLACGYDMVLLVFPGNDSLAIRKEQLQSLCREAGLC